jgi:hypothetical protein
MNLRGSILSLLGRRPTATETDPRLEIIERTPAIATEPIPENGRASSPIGVHLLANDTHVHHALWAAKSFYASAGVSFPLTIHLQGPRTRALADIFRRHFPAARLISQQAADIHVEPWLRDRGLHRLLQMRRKFFLLMKLVDLRLLARTPLVIYLDTDVLFFRHPGELVITPADIAATTHLFMRDDYDSYSITPEKAREDLGIDLAPRANAGIMRLVTDGIDLEACERFITHPDLNNSDWHLEQTLHALNASAQGRISLLPKTYAMLSGLKEDPGLVARHYVSPIRPLLLNEGITHLLESGFVESLATRTRRTLRDNSIPMRNRLKRLLTPVVNHLLTEKLPASAAPADPRPSVYGRVLETRPVPMPAQSDLELHMLVSERDFLRSIWALKSFFHYSDLPARLVLQSDGSLTPASLDHYRVHFPGCVIHADHDHVVRDALADHPLCQFFLGHHAISKKLLHPLLLSQADYILIMDSDILWFRNSKAIANCVQHRLPFYVDGGTEAYARNRRFMETSLDLHPARNVNSGMIGYRRKAFLDLPFIEDALGKLADVPRDKVLDSIGYVDAHVDIHAEDVRATLCWWVMEQTIYALLMGRDQGHRSLRSWSHWRPFHPMDETHQFTNTPVMKMTAMIHYISDANHNRFFPVGVEHLLRRGCLNQWSCPGSIATPPSKNPP